MGKHLKKRKPSFATCQVCGVSGSNVKTRYTTGKSGGKIVGTFCPYHQREK